VLECYRLIIWSYWLDHCFVEVERRAMSATFLARNWTKGSWVTTVSRPLAPAEWQRFSQLLRVAPFWDLPPRGGFDGADYVLEGVKEGHSHYVERWCPDPETDQENLSFPCEFLLELASPRRDDA
jgi:hypothetical protein